MVHARPRNNLGAEGEAPLTDFVAVGAAAATAREHNSQLRGPQSCPMGVEAGPSDANEPVGEAADRIAWSSRLSNAELTGRRRVDGLAVRPMMNQGGRTAKLASRWRSG